MGDWYYLKNRKPVKFEHSILEYTRLFAKESNKRAKQAVSGKKIRRTYLNDYIVSTVFLGLDHGIHEDEPMLFETMIFKGEIGSDIYCDRCATHRNALGMHWKAVDMIKQNKIDDNG